MLCWKAWNTLFCIFCVFIFNFFEKSLHQMTSLMKRKDVSFCLFFICIVYLLYVYFPSFKNSIHQMTSLKRHKDISFLSLFETESTVNPSLGPLISDSRHTMAFHQLVWAYVSHNPLIRFYNWEGGMGMQIIGVVNIWIEAPGTHGVPLAQNKLSLFMRTVRRTQPSTLPPRPPPPSPPPPPPQTVHLSIGLQSQSVWFSVSGAAPLNTSNCTL